MAQIQKYESLIYEEIACFYKKSVRIYSESSRFQVETICEVWYDEIDILGMFTKEIIFGFICSGNKLFKDIALGHIDSKCA